MTTLRQAAQQALEALEQRDNATLWHQAIHALRAALAQEQAEPCPNCASLEAQNDELDRKLAEMERAHGMLARSAAAAIRARKSI